MYTYKPKCINLYPIVNLKKQLSQLDTNQNASIAGFPIVTCCMINQKM